jgi:LytS/YehU family sensor histidine kinase
MRRVLDSSDKIYITIEEERKTLELYLKLEQLQFSSGMEFQFEIDDSLNTSKERIPANILQPFIENSIKHGIAGIRGVGIIIIRILDRESNIQIQIIDNGIGINAGKHRKLAQNIERESKGMQIIEDRLEVLRTMYKLSIYLDITNAKEPIDENMGTEVTITFSKIRNT